MSQEVVAVKEVVEFKKSTYIFRSDGIVEIRIKDDVHLELQDALVEFRTLLDRRSYLPMRSLIVPGQNCSVSKDVRDFSNSEEAKRIVNCQAIVVETLAHKIIANFIKNFYKTPIKTQIFSREKEAIKWLAKQ